MKINGYESSFKLKKVNSKSFFKDVAKERLDKDGNARIGKSEVEKLYKQYTSPLLCNETYMFNMVTMFMMLLTRVF